MDTLARHTRARTGPWQRVNRSPRPTRARPARCRARVTPQLTRPPPPLCLRCVRSLRAVCVVGCLGFGLAVPLVGWQTSVFAGQLCWLSAVCAGGFGRAASLTPLTCLVHCCGTCPFTSSSWSHLPPCPSNHKTNSKQHSRRRPTDIPTTPRGPRNARPCMIATRTFAGSPAAIKASSPTAPHACQDRRPTHTHTLLHVRGVDRQRRDSPRVPARRSAGPGWAASAAAAARSQPSHPSHPCVRRPARQLHVVRRLRRGERERRGDGPRTSMLGGYECRRTCLEVPRGWGAIDGAGGLSVEVARGKVGGWEGGGGGMREGDVNLPVRCELQALWPRSHAAIEHTVPASPPRPGRS